MPTRADFQQISAIARAAKSLPSWSDTTPDQSIVVFVGKVAKVDSAD